MLQEAGTVSYSAERSSSTIFPAEKAACECYATVNARYALLFENAQLFEAERSRLNFKSTRLSQPNRTARHARVCSYLVC